MRFLMILALLGSAFAVPKTVNRIVGGEVTTVEKYPFMANMQYGFLGIWFYQACGGSLLTNDLILSAAHCYQYDRPSDWRVLLGTSLASSGGTLILISQIILHENYDFPTPINNDVALLRLATPVTLSESINLARIPGPAYNLDDNADVFAVGWGTIASNGPSSEQLRDVGIKVINQNLCAERYAYLKTLPGYAGWPDITDGMLCAGILDVGGKDACQGDSGGPLVHQGDIVVGITSWGFGCAHEEYPGVNARVSYYSDWIVQNAS